MSSLTANDFLSTAARALERMAFVIAEPGGQTAGEVLARASHHAQIDICSDSCNAWLMVSATTGFVAEVAAGMMGMDPAEIDVDEHGDATVAELANVLGGELVMALGGAESPMRLGLPVPLDDETAGQRLDAVAGGEAGWSCVLQADSGQLLLACKVG